MLKHIPLKYYNILFGVIFLFSACQHVDSDGFEHLSVEPFQEELTANPVSLGGNIELLNPFHILNADDEYLVITEVRENDFVHVFNLPELDFNYSWGRKGRGPDEFEFFPYYINQTEKELHLYDTILNQLRLFEVGDSILENLGVHSLSYEGQMGQPLNGLIRMNDSLYIADYELTNWNAPLEYIALRPDDDSLFTFGKYPESDLEDAERFFHFRKFSVAKPDGSKFAAFYFHHNMLKIFSRTGERLQAIKIQDAELKQEINEKDRRNFNFRVAGWASDSYLYTLGIQATNEVFEGKADPDFKTFLEIWNWEGQPIYRARFDRFIRAFTVSEKHQKLYGIAPDDTDQLYEYYLTEVLNSIINN